jgi:hypothetical protein
VVIGAFMAVVTGVKGGELRPIEEGGLRGATVAAPWRGRRRGGVHGAAAAREEAVVLPAR